MHSKIIEVSKKPIPKDEWVSESQFYNGFVDWIADYVDDFIDEEQREYLLDEFVFAYREILRGDNEGFVIRNKDVFFNDVRMKLKNVVNNLTVQDFYNNMAKYTIETLIGDPFGYYIYEEGYGLRTLMDFLAETKNNQKYYFGAVIDYHY